MKQKLLAFLLTLLVLLLASCNEKNKGEIIPDPPSSENAEIKTQEKSEEVKTEEKDNVKKDEPIETEDHTKDTEMREKVYNEITFEYPASFTETDESNKLTIRNGMVPIMEVMVLSTGGEKPSLSEIEFGIKGYVSSGINDEIIENSIVEIPITGTNSITKAYTAVWQNIPMKGEITGFYHADSIYIINFINIEENTSLPTYQAIGESITIVPET